MEQELGRSLECVIYFVVYIIIPYMYMYVLHVQTIILCARVMHCQVLFIVVDWCVCVCVCVCLSVCLSKDFLLTRSSYDRETYTL